MAINKLPKLYSTDFRLPNKKPIGDVEIDWANPLASHLVAFVLFNEGAGNPHDLVTGRDVALSNSPAWGVGAKGRKLDFDGVNQSASLPLDLSHTDSVCIAVGCDWPTYANNDDLMLEFNNPSFVGGGLLIDPNSGAPHAGSFSIAANRTLTTSARFTRPSGGYHDYLFGFSPVSSGLSVYVDGLPQSLSYVGAASGTGNYADSQLNIASRAGSSLFGAAGHSYIMVFDKDVSSELASANLTQNPYQILKPKTAPVYFTADGGGSTITVIESLNNSNYVPLNPSILLTGSISITESLVNTNYTALNPTVSFVGIISISESPVNASYTVLNPTISFTGTIAVTESLVNTDYTALSPTVDFTGIVEVTESLVNSDYNALNATVTLTSGAVEIIESTVNTQYTVFNPSILLTPEPLGIVSTVCFNGVLVDLNYSGESGALEFSGQLETAIFNGEFNALDFSGTIQTTCADGDIKTNC